MRYAVIKNGVVVNVIEAPNGYTLPGHTLVASATAGPGDTHTNGTFTPPTPPVVYYDISKADIWRRVTDGEAIALQTALAATSVRLQGIFAGATMLNTGDPDYATLRAGIVAALGEPRAAVVLAPSRP